MRGPRTRPELVGLSGTALLLVGLAWVVTFAVRQSLDAPSFQTPFFVCAIVLSGWLGGLRPGIVATVLSIFLIEFTFTDPRYTFGFTLSEVPKFTVFFFTGAFISWLAHRQRRDEEALLVARENLEEKVRERTLDLEATNAQLKLEIDERTRAERELQRLNRIWRVRSLFNRAVARSHDESELLQRVCQTMIRAGGCELVWIGFPREEGIPAAAHAVTAGIHAPEVAWSNESCGRKLALRSVRSGAPATSDCTALSTTTNSWSVANDIRSILALPLIPDGAAIGSLLVYSGEPDAFDAKETELLRQAANDVAQGIMLFRAREARASAEAALEETQAELARVARVTTVGELTASIAHEINQPLAAVTTNANACLRWLDRTPPNLDEAREAARRIIRDGKRGSEVITRIRAMLKKEDSVREPIAIAAVVEEITALTRDELEDVRLERNFDCPLPLVVADRVQIQQVLLNLILNAIDAMSSADRAKTLLIAAQCIDEKHVEVSVRDTGVGLPPDRLEKIFSTFFTTKANGLGMGLAICRSIIEHHGGRLWAEANNDCGATFRFTLPVKEAV